MCAKNHFDGQFCKGGIVLLNQASIIRENRKTIKIVVTSGGELLVFCPHSVELSKIEQILIQKQPILTQKIERARQVFDKFENVVKKESILLFGKQFLIVGTKKVKKACFSGDYFLVPQKILEENRLDFCIKSVLKEMAGRILPKRVKDICQACNFKPNKIVVGNFRAKWGSCDSFGVLKFNWRLAMTPPKLVDFVIFHELTHLVELNHSKKFYAELQKLCPNWKNCRENLKNFNFILTLYL